MADLIAVTVIAPSGARMGGRYLGMTKGGPKRLLIGFPSKPARFDFQGLGVDAANHGWTLAPESLAVIAEAHGGKLTGDSSRPPHIERSAVISPCKRYRYELARWWADGPRALFVMLNPSTGDADKDDATGSSTRRTVATSTDSACCARGWSGSRSW